MKERNLLELWKLCRLASNDCKDVPAEAIVISAGRDRGYIHIVGNEAFVVIDGSSNLPEWMSDFNIFRHGQYLQHDGFADTATIFIDQVMKHLKHFKGMIIFIGHSRGGAIAQIIADEFLDTNKCQTYTFGSPKVGGLKYYKFCESNRKHHVRVVMKRDLVTHLPITFFWKHYQSTTVELHHTEHGIKDIHLGYGEYLYGIVE